MTFNQSNSYASLHSIIVLLHSKIYYEIFQVKKNHIPFKVLPCLNCSIDNDGDGIIDEDCIEETSKLIFIH